MTLLKCRFEEVDLSFAFVELSATENLESYCHALTVSVIYITEFCGCLFALLCTDSLQLV